MDKDLNPMTTSADTRGLGMKGILGAQLRKAALLVAGLAASLTVSAAETFEYIHTDALGSPVAVTDANGVVIERTVYEPYGAVVGGPVKDGPGYTGHVSDSATGLSYMQQRYYDPELGTFLSVDPISAGAQLVSLFNRFRYANGNPYRYYDPDGRCTGSRIENNDGTCKSSGEATTKSTAATVGRNGAKKVLVPEIVKIEQQGYATADDAAKAAGEQYGETGTTNKQELQLGLTRLSEGDWGYLTPGWGPVGAKRVDPQALMDAYVAAGFKVNAWMHGHFDTELNFSATDFGLVWGNRSSAYMVNRKGEVRVLNDSHLKSALRRLPFAERKNGLSALESVFKDPGLPGDKL